MVSLPTGDEEKKTSQHNGQTPQHGHAASDYSEDHVEGRRHGRLRGRGEEIGHFPGSALLQCANLLRDDDTGAHADAYRP
jgi:hypothetical protein